MTPSGSCTVNNGPNTTNEVPNLALGYNLSLSEVRIVKIIFFDFLEIKLSVANPLLIVQIKKILTKTYQKGVYIVRFDFSCFLLKR